MKICVKRSAVLNCSRPRSFSLQWGERERDRQTSRQTEREEKESMRMRQSYSNLNYPKESCTQEANLYLTTLGRSMI